MEQLIIFLLFVLASIVSSIVQNKKKREEAEREGLPPPPPVRPFEQWPETVTDWQEQLKRVLNPEEPEKPPVIAPAQAPSPVYTPPPSPAPVQTATAREGTPGPLKTSVDAYSHAADLHERVRERMRSVAASTSLHHRPAAGRKMERTSRSSLTRWTRNPHALREAFIASLIFSPPPSLDRR